MKVGRKQKLIDGGEVDFIYGRKYYFHNNAKIKRWIKKKINKRYRRENNQMIMDGLNE